MKIIITMLMILTTVFISSADITPSTNNHCTWQLESYKEVQFTYGKYTPSLFKHNIIEIEYKKNLEAVGELSILIQENETYIDTKYVRKLVALNRISNTCVWNEYWQPTISADINHPVDSDILITNVTLSGQETFSFESRIWRNPNRLANDNTTKPSIGGLG